MRPLPPRSTLFPYTTLFRSFVAVPRLDPCADAFQACSVLNRADQRSQERELLPRPIEDRKSTRLNSSHVEISYAVFCLKKKSRAGTLHRRNSAYTTRQCTDR